MPKPSSLTLAAKRITAHFANRSQRIYSEAQLHGVLVEMREAWGLAKSTRPDQFNSFHFCSEPVT